MKKKRKQRGDTMQDVEQTTLNEETVEQTEKAEAAHETMCRR